MYRYTIKHKNDETEIKTSKRMTQIDKADAFLRFALRHGAQKRKRLVKEAERNHISRGSLERAALGVIYSCTVGFAEKREAWWAMEPQPWNEEKWKRKSL